MCEPEVDFFTKYTKSLAAYMRAVGADLTADMAPPKSLYVEVRVRQDHGEIETPDGEVVLLKAGSQHHLPRCGPSSASATSSTTSSISSTTSSTPTTTSRDLCEQLIMQGVLEHVTS